MTNFKTSQRSLKTNTIKVIRGIREQLKALYRLTCSFLRTQLNLKFKKRSHDSAKRMTNESKIKSSFKVYENKWSKT